MRTADVMAHSMSKYDSQRSYRIAAERVAGVKGKQRLEWLMINWSVKHQVDLWGTE
jgi:hypothetical protein